MDLGGKDISEVESSIYENQTSDFSQRRHTDNDMVRPNLTANKLEFTTQKLRQEFPEEQDQLYDEIKEKFNLRRESNQFRPITEDGQNDSDKSGNAPDTPPELEAPKSDPKEKADEKSLVKDDKTGTANQSKKKRRKKSMIKKKNTQRKNSSSSSAGSVASDAAAENEAVENNSGTSNDVSPSTDNDITKELPRDAEPVQTQESRVRERELDIHFFSDGELASGLSPQQSRPNTPGKSIL